MPRWSELLKSDSLSWLLEPDIENTAVRYLTLRDIIGSPPDSPELLEAKAAAMATGTIAAVLDRQRPAGYWVKPGGGYGPKYTGTVWSLTLLAQMGADKSELRVRKAATYVLENTITPQGWFSYNGTPSGFLHCHAGYLGDAMYSLGFGDDPRVGYRSLSVVCSFNGLLPATPDSHYARLRFSYNLAFPARFIRLARYYTPCPM